MLQRRRRRRRRCNWGGIVVVVVVWDSPIAAIFSFNLVPSMCHFPLWICFRLRSVSSITVWKVFSKSMRKSVVATFAISHLPSNSLCIYLPTTHPPSCQREPGFVIKNTVGCPRPREVASIDIESLADRSRSHGAPLIMCICVCLIFRRNYLRSPKLGLFLVLPPVPAATQCQHVKSLSSEPMSPFGCIGSLNFLSFRVPPRRSLHIDFPVHASMHLVRLRDAIYPSFYLVPPPIEERERERERAAAASSKCYSSCALPYGKLEKWSCLLRNFSSRLPFAYRQGDCAPPRATSCLVHEHPLSWYS